MDNIKELQAAIKQLKQEVAGLKKSKQQLERILDLMPGHVYWLDKNNVYLGCNKLQAKSAELKSNKDIIGKTNYDFLQEKHAVAVEKLNNKVMQNKKSYIAEEPVFLDHENRVYLSQKVPLYDQKGEVSGILGISFDITERKKLEQELKQAKQRAEAAEQEKLKYLAKMNQLITGQESKIDKSVEEHAQEMIDYLNNIISLIPGHVYWLDRNNVFLGCNDQQAKTIGLISRHEIIGKTIYDFQARENAEAIIKINNDIMTTRIPQVTEEKAFLEDGYSEGTYLSYKTPLYNKNNNVIGLLGVSFDITERKQLEEKLRSAKEKAEIANRAKTEFLANISHDIRTPLSGIIGMTQVLQSRLTKQGDKELVKNIAQSAKQLLKILNLVIEFSESASYPVCYNKFNLKTCIKEVTEVFATNIKEKNLKMNINYLTDIPKYFIGDDVRINRVVLNLLNNAIKFTPAGDISINVAMQQQKNNDQVTLQLTIADTGIGIPQDKIDNIFEKFVRLSDSHKGIYQGAGLGLAIVKRLIIDMQGTIEVTSEINKGSTFICKIPLSLPKDKETYKFIKPPCEKIQIPKLNILLIEDDKVCQLSQQILLNELGHNIDIADSGQAAIKAITKPYDLIISDIGLPDIDGYKLAEKIRQSDNNQNTPIIALTAHVSEENKIKCFNAGIDIVLHKPMDQEEIKSAMYTLTKKTKKNNK